MIRLSTSVLFFLCSLLCQTTSAQTDYYKQEEVTFKNHNITFSGTLTIPFSSMKYPAVILISGSKTHDRNYNNSGFEMFRVLADYFTRNGFAVLRFDERGLGQSTGDISRAAIKDFSADVFSAVRFLKSRPEIDSKHIGLCGHDKGGLVASQAASRSKDIDFLILMSSSSIPGDKLLLLQFRNMMKAKGAPDQIIDEETSLREKFLSIVKKGRSKTQLTREFRKYLLTNFNKRSEEFKRQVPDKEEYIRNLTETLCSDFNIPVYRNFLNYDPALALAKVKCPVLATFACKDTIVPAEENKAAMIKIFEKSSNRAYEIKLFPEANHLYVDAKTGGAQEYSGLTKEFVPGYIEFLGQWMRNLFPQE